jgi:hypothetical protein
LYTNQKLQISIIIFLVIAIGLGYGGYTLSQNQNKSEPKSTTSKPSIVSSATTLTSSSSIPVVSKSSKTYQNANYPAFSFVYDSTWNIKESTSETNSLIVELTKDTSKLSFFLASAFPTGYAGPLPCWNGFAKLTSGDFRVKSENGGTDEYGSVNPNWQYIGKDAINSFSQKGTKEFNDTVASNKELFGEDYKIKDENTTCGMTLFSFNTKTTYPTIMEDNKGEGIFSVSYYGADKDLPQADIVINTLKY